MKTSQAKTSWSSRLNICARMRNQNPELTFWPLRFKDSEKHQAFEQTRQPNFTQHLFSWIVILVCMGILWGISFFSHDGFSKVQGFQLIALLLTGIVSLIVAYKSVDKLPYCTLSGWVLLSVGLICFDVIQDDKIESI